MIAGCDDCPNGSCVPQWKTEHMIRKTGNENTSTFVKKHNPAFATYSSHVFYELHLLISLLDFSDYPSRTA